MLQYEVQQDLNLVDSLDGAIKGLSKKMRGAVLDEHAVLLIRHGTDLSLCCVFH